ncbi:post-gpi attachment to proteins factor 3-like [Plakobranchus ocellatus]|uniref:Post-GPI attachment to proteins factor 3 n=1 Tax=Plakobranchus ocellatus TaxID=259542 RepID=A0AAV4CYX7_9GAST|nr:post-gpi attachment to proteins factor 3-like [Plakobranchus ocellatus]
MWATVDAYHLDGSRVPQFYGKWPFVRFAGVQEPASMVFSLLNALCHLSIVLYRSKVPSSTPLYYVWHGMALVGVITWLCAAIFHTRETPLTEKLDYFSAFALVLYNIFTLTCRVIGTDFKFPIALAALWLIICYCYHIYYLSFVLFDYGYNMMMNVSAGLLALLSLELGDFPPLWWILDAHALWHAGTVPMTLLWYSFIIDDALHEKSPDGRGDVKKMV